MTVATILKRIKAGNTLYIATALRTTVISPSTLARWEKAGLPILRDGKEGERGFYLARGKRWDYVEPMGCKVYFE